MVAVMEATVEMVGMVEIVEMAEMAVVEVEAAVQSNTRQSALRALKMSAAPPTNPSVETSL